MQAEAYERHFTGHKAPVAIEFSYYNCELVETEDVAKTISYT